MKLFVRRITGSHATDELWDNSAEDGFTVISSDFSKENSAEKSFPGVCGITAEEKNFCEYDYSVHDTPLLKFFRDGCFTVENLIIPVYLHHVIRAIANIYPLDRYLAAHYERQLTAVLRQLKPEDEDLLASLALKNEFDNTGNQNADAFLRFQKKLYLTYLREE